MTHGGTVPEENRIREAAALALLKSFIAKALSLSGKATQVVVRVPLHGPKLGEPIAYVEQKA